MLSSLASFLFGTNTTSETTLSVEEQQQQQQQQQQVQSATRRVIADAGDVIQVSSTTPSVTGTSNAIAPNRCGGKRGKQRRANKGRQQQQAGAQKKATTPTITKLCTANGNDSLDEDIDEDEWFIVDKEDDAEQSLPQSDSDEGLTVIELQAQPNGPLPAGWRRQRSQPHPQHYINTHSLYSGPRPHQQRNYLQRAARATNGTHARAPLSISTLSPPRSVPGIVGGAGHGVNDADLADNNGGVTQSLYAVSTISPSGSDHDHIASISMEESWYVTPPPCFTSIGPINMETSPFENLLIEHPSMSVYHSIRSAQAATDSYLNLDLGINAGTRQHEQSMAVDSEQQQHQQQQQSVQQRNANNARIDRQAAAQLKQQVLARSSQMSHNKKDHQKLCRGAIKRANKVREVQAKSQRPRRSDMQHCNRNSGANNNRSKCCY